MRTRAGRLLACGVFFLGLLAALPVHARPAEMGDFPLFAPLTGSDYGAPVQVALPREILSRTSRSLEHIRIFDDLRRETPFFIHVSGKPAPSFVPWEIQGSQAIGEDHVFLLGRTPGMGAVDTLFINSGQAWACSDVEVSSSVDGLSWQPLATGRVANLRPVMNSRWMSIGLPETHAPFLKVVFVKMRREGGLSPFGCFSARPRGMDLEEPRSFSDVRGFVSRVSRGRASEVEYDAVAIENFARSTDSRKNTIIELPGVSLPVTEVAFEVGQSCFYRDVAVFAGGEEKGSAWARRSSGGICRIPGLGLSRLALAADVGSAPRIMIRIVNNGEPPLALGRIILRWPRTHLIFVPQQGRTYRLCYGADDAPSPAAPSSVAPGGGPMARWEAGGPLINETYIPRTEGARDIRKFMTVAVIILVLYCVGFWTLQIRNAMRRR